MLQFAEGNLYHCLENIPETSAKSSRNTAFCGNFFVEEEEECDCGQPEYCLSNCCDPTTCKLYSNATCATGSCCDLETCTVRPISYPCRSVQDSQCDLPETCDGDSEWCPVDTYKHDGTECTNIEQGYCYEGKCNTHSSQCQLIWGVENGAKKSDDLCYKDSNNLRQNLNSNVVVEHD
ncbi:hypothetical protein EB796_003941 [Bugula neritina]|uniref:Disintegrin domain-containing protein n=1 Tax=Bugula neritina TaxID=10212 RepID=A0A7J7KIL1_BUGNE|nr:hypothetical protein EB796_003941 [Bugula neritina]